MISWRPWEKGKMHWTTTDIMERRPIEESRSTFDQNDLKSWNNVRGKEFLANDDDDGFYYYFTTLFHNLAGNCFNFSLLGRLSSKLNL